MKKKENIIKYNFYSGVDIKPIKNDYETIRNKVLNDDNSINKINIEKNNDNYIKNNINKNILNFQIT